MTALLLGLSILQSGTPRVIESPMPGSGLVVVQAYILAPNLGPADAAALKVVGETLLDGTQEFTRNELLSYGAQAGLPPTVSILPDFAKVQIAVPKRGLTVAIALIESILVRSNLKLEDLEAHRSTLMVRHRPAWSAALDPRLLPYKDLRAGDYARVRDSLFRPENIVIAVGGDFDQGDGAKEVKKAFGSWSLGPKKYVPKPIPIPISASNDEAVSSYELYGLPIATSQPAWAQQFLAMFALGVGKESSVTRVFREKMQISYRQETVLWPSLQGWIPRLFVVASPSVNSSERIDGFRAALQEDIGSWSELTLERAKSMALASLNRDLPVSPFWLDTSGPARSDVASRTSWDAFSSLVKMPELNRGTMATAFGSVTLDELKAAAENFVKTAIPRSLD